MKIEQNNFKALTKDSKNLQDFKDYKPEKTFQDFASSKNHTELFCKPHMKDRLKQYCYQECLVDVILSGTLLSFEQVTTENEKCKVQNCTESAKYRIVRTDVY